MSSLDDLKPLLLFLWNKRKPILLSGIIAAVLTAIFFSPLITPPEYESSAILFAPRSGYTTDKLPEEPEFGYDVDADRLMQILESNGVRDSIIRRFNLATHYDIDTTTAKGKEKLMRKYADNVNFERTRYMSVIIKVDDTDPKLATKIANTIPEMGDKIKADALRKNMYSTMIALEEENNGKVDYLRKFRDSLEKHPDVRLEQQYHDDVILASELYMKYQRALHTWNKPISAAYIISTAETPYKKKYPFITLFSGIAFLLTTIMTTVLIAVKEEISKMNLGKMS